MTLLLSYTNMQFSYNTCAKNVLNLVYREVLYYAVNKRSDVSEKSNSSVFRET